MRIMDCEIMKCEDPLYAQFDEQYKLDCPLPWLWNRLVHFDKFTC